MRLEIGASLKGANPLRSLRVLFSHVREPFKITSCNHQSCVTEFLGHEIAEAALTHGTTGKNGCVSGSEN